VQLAFMTLGCPSWDLDTICARGRDYGYDGVELRGYRESLDVTTHPLFTTHAADTRRRLADAGLAVSGISSSIRVCDAAAREENLEEALEYLKGLGVVIERLGQDIVMNQERCIQCGACTGFCPTGALDYERPAMKVVFNEDKCIACELCLTACLTRAMEGKFKG
jgi:NAD-dependent dihydropyrimidine dehydrogenase PreA subunit